MKRGGLTICLGVVALFATQLIAGCSTVSQDSVRFASPPSAVESEFAGLSPEEIAGTAEQKVEDGRGAQLDFYSPALFAGATAELQNLKKLKIESGNREQIIAISRRINANIDGAREVKREAEKVLQISLSEKQLLDEYAADKYFPKDYSAITKQFQEAFKKIEENNPGEALKIEPRLTENIRVLMIRTIDASLLSESRDFLAKADKIDADKLAPKSFGEAKLRVQQASNYISTYPRNKEGVKEQAVKSTNVSRHAYSVAQEVQTLTKLKAVDVEAFVLGLEEQLIAVAELLKNQEEIRYLTLQQKAAALLAEVNKVVGALRDKTAESAALSKDKDALAAKLSELQGVEGRRAEAEEKNSVLRAEVLKLNGELKSKQDMLVDLETVRQGLVAAKGKIAYMEAEKESLVAQLKAKSESQAAVPEKNQAGAVSGGANEAASPVPVDVIQ